MAFKPNYNQQRAERVRAKQAKKDAKLTDREDAAARRKAEQDAIPGDEPTDTTAPTAGNEQSTPS